MPCYAIRTTTQVLENIPDIQLLGKGLEEMGFKVNASADWLKFNGIDKTTGKWQSGSYQNGKLTTQEGLNLDMLAKYVAKANVIKQVEDNQNDKYKAQKISISWTGEFDFVITKK